MAMQDKKARQHNGQNGKFGCSVPDEADILRRQGRGKIESDVLGSYTGSPAEGEQPEQDADDL